MKIIEFFVKRPTVLTVAAVVMLSAVAVAGTPCRDPFDYKITPGKCYLNLGCVPMGFVGTPYNLVEGGCKAPGNSAYECEEKYVTFNTKYGKVAGAVFQDSCSRWVYPGCTDKEITLMGVKYGKTNTMLPCKYESTVPVEPEL